MEKISRTDAPSASSGRNQTLLVVEDDPQVSALLQIVLEGEGYGVILAHDGRQALDTLNQSRHKPVDLVMMDLNMPVMDGRECLRAMDGLGCRVPVLLLSGDPLEDIADSLPTRVAGLVQKPVGMRALVGQVRRVLEGQA